MSVEATTVKMAQAAKEASLTMARCPSQKKQDVLLEIAAKLEQKSEFIQAQNAIDLVRAKKMGLTAAMIDRLTITDATLKTIVDGLRVVAGLNDPIGAMGQTWIRPNGLQVARMRIPLGVIGIIYESRPNVTVDAAGLCLKAGNAVILRGGSEAFHSNQALGGIMGEALHKFGLPPEAAQVIPTRDREAVNILLDQEESVDLIIPRGGEELISFVVKNSKIPVLKHYKGVCHVYVDQSADLDMAAEICFNAKVQRPGVCNAMETLLVHEAVAPDFLPDMAGRFLEAGVELRGCPQSCRIIPNATAAVETDWPAEYLDLVVAIKVVSDMDEAVHHICRFGSQHTDAIVTSNIERAQTFIREVDSSVVLVNASTRFNDGGQLGLGAEIGISTSKLHAFGPMGVNELTTTKFVVFGNGQTRT